MNSQLTTQQTTHRQLVESFRQKILEKTDGGDLIIDFLISAMKGVKGGAKTCHRGGVKVYHLG